MYVHFSPMQNKSGLLVYHHKGLTLNLLVLPKMWRPKGALLNPWDFSKKILNVVAYEGERHHIALPKESTDTTPWENWKALLQHCCDTLSSKTKLKDSDDDLLDEDTLKSLSGLMSRISKPADHLLTKLSNDSSAYDWNIQIENLFKLALFSSTTNHFDINIFQSNDDQVVALTNDSTITNDSPIFRMLAIENFLGEIETHIHNIHQGYVKTTEDLDTIRGSVTGTSLMMIDAGVSLKPQCRYNKFVPNIPLYQVLVTTLDAIHRGWCIPNDPVLKHIGIVQKTKTRALRLRTRLRHITSLPLEVARNTCQRLHLNRLQLFWAPAVNLSKILLRNKPVFIDHSVSGSGGYMWLVNTAAVWESILAQALRTQLSTFHVRTHVKAKQSWIGRGDQPDADLVAVSNKCLYIFDAKYKINNADKTKPNEFPDNKMPTKGEEYQMFAYSHLLAPKWKGLAVQDSGPIKGIHLGLIYPTFTANSYPYNRYIDEDKDNKKEIRTFWRGYHSESAPVQTPCSLSIYYLSFPSVVDVSTHELWGKKMKLIGKQWTGIEQNEQDENGKKKEPFYKKWENRPTKQSVDSTEAQ